MELETRNKLLFQHSKKQKIALCVCWLIQRY